MGRSRQLSESRKANLTLLHAKNQLASAPSTSQPLPLANITNHTISTRSSAKSNSTIQSLQALLTEKNSLIAVQDAELLALRVSLAEANVELIDVRKIRDTTLLQNMSLHSEVATLTQKLSGSRIARKSAVTSLRLAESGDQKGRKRIRRLEKEILTLKQTHADELNALQEDVRTANAHTESIQSQYDTLILASESKDSHLSKSRQLITSLRKEIYAIEKQAHRSKETLSRVRAALKKVSTWSATTGGVYTPAARKLYRALKKAGCKNFKLAISACSEAFGITITRIMSRRTGERCATEVGMYGLMQLGREITQADSFGTSSDGTTIAGITQESRSITLAVPSYDLDADDSDKSTWTTTTRFAETAPALDHTAKTQLEGDLELVRRIADTYSSSPLASRDGLQMDADDYVRKQVFQSMDHAADGKKKLKLTKEHKTNLVQQDLGRERMDSMDADAILKKALEITEADILKEAGLKPKQAKELSSAKRGEIVHTLLERSLGKLSFDDLPEEEQKKLTMVVFAGCGGHKDLNAFKYGVVEMAATWETEGRTPPVELGNKAQGVAIQIATDNGDSESLDACLKSCPRGAIKLLELMGALLRHKDGDTGYQEKHRTFMAERKFEVHGIPKSEGGKKYPDTQQCRYQSFSYAGAETLTFHDLYCELISDVCDGKVKRGMNHVEENCMKGLTDIPTLTELAAIALYGVSVSWPYLREIRCIDPGSDEKFVNALDMEPLHRRIPEFCERIALDPSLLFEVDQPVTLDDKPYMDRMIVATVASLRDELPDLELIISAMFAGAAKGWQIFTSEFSPDSNDPDSYAFFSPELRNHLGRIPMTNDVSEGNLGSLRIFLRSNPSSSANKFSSMARGTRNNTENFIVKHCDNADQKYVMRLTREYDKQGVYREFKRQFYEAQKKRAEKARVKEAENAKKKAEEIARLSLIGVVLTRAEIDRLKVPELKDQIKIYRDRLKHECLKNFAVSKYGKEALRIVVQAALTRNTHRIDESATDTAPNPANVRCEDVEMEDANQSTDIND